MKTRQLVAELFFADGRTDRQTDMMELIVAFHNFVKMSPNPSFGLTYLSL
jgi:hypothetical protein